VPLLSLKELFVNSSMMREKELFLKEREEGWKTSWWGTFVG
jgi:hypothetical protein